MSRCKPNAGHHTLVEMESYFEDFSLIIQNVDGLHIRAGSRNVLELHGNMWKDGCTRCSRIVELLETPLKTLPPHCVCGYEQFGEPIDNRILNTAFAASRRMELFLVVGTSGVVSPASQMLLLTLENRAKVIEVNPDPTVLTPHMSFVRGIPSEIVEGVPYNRMF